MQTIIYIAMNSMMGNKAVLFCGIVVVAAATWFAFTPPTVPQLPFSTTPTPDNSAETAIPPSMPVAVADTAAPAKTIHIRFTSPTSSSVLVIGTSYDITWDVPGGLHGQLSLVDAGTGQVVGWIEQSVGPAQVMYPWTVRSVLVNGTSAAAKDIAPGRYQLRVTYPSAQVPEAESAAFEVVAATPTE